MAINREWHEKHRMPKKPTKEEKLKWHFGHAKHCSCREAPEWVKEEMRKRDNRFA